MSLTKFQLSWSNGVDLYIVYTFTIRGQFFILIHVVTNSFAILGNVVTTMQREPSVMEKVQTQTTTQCGKSLIQM